MVEEAKQQVTFPRKGSNYEPLPKEKTHDRVVAHAVQTIANTTPEQVFQVYSRAELLPAWQEGVVSVNKTGDRTLHWVAQAPGTTKQTEFDSEVVEFVPGVRHVSRIVSGPFTGSTDTATFNASANGRGTVVTLVSEYTLPTGFLANAVAAVVSRSPEQTTIENLRHLKQLIESHEIPNVEGQPAGPRGVMGKWKQFLMGENLPTPPGSSDRAKPRDLPEGKLSANDEEHTAMVLGGVAALVGLAAWYGIRRLR